MIKVHDLVKKYKSFEALKGLSFHVKAGDIFGFIGSNGAGKSTTMRIMATLMKPTSGHVFISDVEVIPENYLEIKKKIGFMPQNIRLAENLYASEIIELFCKLRNCESNKYLKLLKEINGDNTKKLKYLSPGNQKKIQIILSVIGSPELILLDEPTAGLDPLGIQDFYNILKEFKSKNHTFFISSHNLKELSALCNNIAIIHDGEIVHTGVCKDAFEIETDELLIADKEKIQKLTNVFEQLGFKSKIDNCLITVFTEKEKIPQILEVLRNENISVFGVKEQGLDTFYNEIIKKQNHEK